MLTNIYLNAVRSHVDLLVRRGRTDKLIIWDVGRDEIHDPTLIAYRAYGNRDNADVVMLCAGTNRVGEALPNRRIYLPLPASLAQIKRTYTNSGLIDGVING
ncbi:MULTISPECIES: hypothetical protein [unclassified Psychrobacter]|uniref:hypothetical protein n=1 Tax=unclassified Psychrobacter TaxID=196806 RepID=UPI0017880C80|nr:hypothetical protein [Psychrobacter sp. FME13]MBE0440601.1 hypothetical protein [Psychrobacter sp. FME13]